MVRSWVAVVLAFGCGGGGDANPDGAPADAAIDADEGTGFRVEVAIAGVRDPMTVALHADGLPDQHLPITQDGTFHFPIRVADGTTVSVTATSAQQCDPPTANATVAGATATVAVTCDGVVDLRAFSSTVPLRLAPAFDPRVTSYRVIEPLLLDPGEPGDRMTVTASPMYATATVGTQPMGPIAVPPIGPASSALTITLSSSGLADRNYAFAMSRDLVRESYVKASDTAASSSFGGFRASIATPANGVAVSGDLLAVGAPRASGDSGAVYVYTRAGFQWKFQQKLPGVVGSSFFGAAVALDSGAKTLAIGAPSDGTGSVYIYHLAGATWTQDQTLRPPAQAVTPKSFGGALALANGALVIGAPDENPSGAVFAGAAYVYRDPGTGVWAFEARLATAATDGHFGTGVAIAGDAARIAVGAPGDNAGQGAAYVFTAPAWTVSPRISGSGTNSFGGSLGIDADVLVVGAFGEQPTAGRAHVFVRNGTSWPASATTPTLAGQASAELFGFSVAMRRGRAIIGAPSDDEGGAFNCGAVYFFRCTAAGSCALERRAVQSHPGNGDRFGHSVALDNVTFAVGAPAEQSNAINIDGDETNDSLLNAGAVYVFR